MFIGREAELQFLNDKYEENKGQLIVLYGRRRVGKTETLREFCKGKFPYMCRGNKSIPSILQDLWNAEFKNSNVMLILCGSAMSFIEKELLVFTVLFQS